MKMCDTNYCKDKPKVRQASKQRITITKTYNSSEKLEEKIIYKQRFYLNRTPIKKILVQ